MAVKEMALKVVYPDRSFQSVIPKALAPVIIPLLRKAMSVCGYASNDRKLATVREQKG